jgi:hypothetical protein
VSVIIHMKLMLFMSSTMEKYQRKSRYASCDQAVEILNISSCSIILTLIEYYLATVDRRIFASGCQVCGGKYAAEKIMNNRLISHIHMDCEAPDY